MSRSARFTIAATAGFPELHVEGVHPMGDNPPQLCSESVAFRSDEAVDRTALTSLLYATIRSIMISVGEHCTAGTDDGITGVEQLPVLQLIRFLKFPLHYIKIRQQHSSASTSTAFFVTFAAITCWSSPSGWYEPALALSGRSQPSCTSHISNLDHQDKPIQLSHDRRICRHTARHAAPSQAPEGPDELFFPRGV